MVPNCEAKNRMMIFYRKFMKIRESYKARNVTLEQRQRMSGLADDLENYVLNNFEVPLLHLPFPWHLRSTCLDTLTWRSLQCSR